MEWLLTPFIGTVELAPTPLTFSGVWAIILILVTIIGAALVLASKWSRDSRNELQILAETRAETISDLRHEMIERQEKCDAVLFDLNSRITFLEGKIEGIQNIKQEAIAAEVLSKIR